MCVCLCTRERKCVCMQIQLKLFLSNLVYFFLYLVQLFWQWFFKYRSKWKQLDWASVFRDQSEKFCDVSSLTTTLNVILFIHLLCEGTFLIPSLRFSVYFIVWLWILTHKYLSSLKALNSRYFLFQIMWHSGVKFSGDLSSQPLMRLWSSYHLSLWSILNVHLEKSLISASLGCSRPQLLEAVEQGPSVLWLLVNNSISVSHLSLSSWKSKESKKGCGHPKAKVNLSVTHNHIHCPHQVENQIWMDVVSVVDKYKYLSQIYLTFFIIYMVLLYLALPYLVSVPVRPALCWGSRGRLDLG